MSSTFIQSFVNYTPIVEARLLDRYEKPDENAATLEAFMREGRHHTNIGELFKDDVMLLAKATPEDPYYKKLGPTWWVYWFDRDVSDCTIACFRTDKSDEQVREDFRLWVGSLDYESSEIPVEGFRGWITF